MKKRLLPLAAPVLMVSVSDGALIYRDDFDDGNPAINHYAGNTLQDNAANPMTESGSAVRWSSSGGWGWGGSNVQSNETFAFPVPGKKYTIEWKIGPLAVTTPSDQPWGDIRMQLNLLSENSGQGNPGSAEFWTLTAGGLGVDIAYKAGVNPYANFVAKNDTQPAALDSTQLPGQTGQQINVTQDNVFRIELTNTEASLYINGTLSQTNPLYLWGLGAGPGEEFENGFFLSTRGARVNNGLGTMSVDRVTVEVSDVAIPSTSWIWWEGESPSSSNLPATTFLSPSNQSERDALSGGNIRTAGDIINFGPYFANYPVIVAQAGTYRLYARKIWEYGVFKWRFDSAAWSFAPSRLQLIDSADYKQYFPLNWVYLGEVTLTAGVHTFRVETDAADWPNEAVNNKSFGGFDAFILSTQPFIPRGKLKPGQTYDLAEPGKWNFESLVRAVKRLGTGRDALKQLGTAEGQ